MAQKTIVYFGPGSEGIPDLVERFAKEHGLTLALVNSRDETTALLNRSFPAAVVLDATDDAEAVLDLCRGLKADAFTATVPVVILMAEAEDPETSAKGLEAGADEVVAVVGADRETWLRLELVLRRADRDVSVHPTTRLPGNGSDRA